VRALVLSSALPKLFTAGIDSALTLSFTTPRLSAEALSYIYSRLQSPTSEVDILPPTPPANRSPPITTSKPSNTPLAHPSAAISPSSQQFTGSSSASASILFPRAMCGTQRRGHNLPSRYVRYSLLHYLFPYCRAIMAAFLLQRLSSPVFRSASRTGCRIPAPPFLLSPPRRSHLLQFLT
jgi:hypothetical protein